MSDITTNTVSRYRPKPRLHIKVDGDDWGPRSDFAKKVLGVTDRTAARMNLRTTYIAGVAYVPFGESLREVIARARRRNEPVKRRQRA
jgi:hypothetical protein